VHSTCSKNKGEETEPLPFPSIKLKSYRISPREIWKILLLSLVKLGTYTSFCIKARVVLIRGEKLNSKEY